MTNRSAEDAMTDQERLVEFCEKAGVRHEELGNEVHVHMLYFRFDSDGVLLAYGPLK